MAQVVQCDLGPTDPHRGGYLEWDHLSDHLVFQELPVLRRAQAFANLPLKPVVVAQEPMYGLLNRRPYSSAILVSFGLLIVGQSHGHGFSHLLFQHYRNLAPLAHESKRYVLHQGNVLSVVTSDSAASP